MHRSKNYRQTRHMCNGLLLLQRCSSALCTFETLALLASAGISVISCGGLFTCALTKGGGIWCWGENNYGQLGIASSAVQQNIPTPVSLGSGVIPAQAHLIETGS